MRLDNSTPQSRVYLSTAYTGPLSVTNIQDVPSNLYATVDRIEKQSSSIDKDVAIIHVSNMNDMAIVQLGDSKACNQIRPFLIIHPIYLAIGIRLKTNSSKSQTNILYSKASNHT